MRGGIGMMVCLDFDDAPARAVEQKRGADQFRRDRMNAAGKKIAVQTASAGHMALRGRDMRKTMVGILALISSAATGLVRRQRKQHT
jgi:hypothetical protein